MQFEDIRPVLSGIVGGLVAMGVYRLWSGSLPKGLNGKSAETLLLQYRSAIWISNTASILGILFSLALSTWGSYASNDWRPLALGFGTAFSAPLAILPIVSSVIGGNISEAYIAYAIAQKTPPMLLYPLLALGVPVLCLGILKW